MKKLAIVVGILIGLVVVGRLALDDTSTLPSSVDTTVHAADVTSSRKAASGTFVGFADKYDSQAWLGIPFAEAPVAELRWQAPVAAPPRDKPLQALAYQSPCVQYWSPLAGVAGEDGQLVGSEDCLYLNVWAPASRQEAVPTGDQRLPVMVWIHGGGNTIGTANTYQGHHLASDQEVIFVALNYRLGVLGWFGHEAIRNTSASLEDASGNYGVLDMITGLQWVNENISAFGGDPDNITIFGESAGGRDVYALLGSPLAKGLFHKAIVQSGSTLTTTRSRAENYMDDPEPGMSWSSRELINAVVVNTGNADDRDAAKAVISDMPDQAIVDLMRDQTPAELFSVIDAAGFGMYRSPQNLRDGHVLPLEPLMERFGNADDYNSVPLILGTNRDESKVFMAQDPEYISHWFGVIPRIKDETLYNHFAAYSSDLWKALSVDEPATILSETQGNVYAYRFDWDESPSTWLVDFPTLLGAGHGLEVSYVFGDFYGGISIPYLLSEENETGRLALSTSMMNYWGEFAHSGSPGLGRDGEQVKWTAWNNMGDRILLLDTEAGGGIRMSDTLMTAQSLKQRLQGDTLIATQHDLCRLYANLFINSYQATDFWEQGEYDKLGEGGCRQYDPYQFE